jgi:ATP-dependent helicase/nuclease subunit B
VPIGSETFIISAKADRIDELTSGNARIIDYKTGTAAFSKKTAQSYSPQLDLEGWISAGRRVQGHGCAHRK